MGGRQGSNVIFFLQICNEVPGEKKGGLSPHPTGDIAPPSGDQWARPTSAAGGPVAPPGDRGTPLYKHPTPIPPHLSPKIPPKIQKKREGEEKGSGEALPDSALVICRLVHLVYIFFHLSTTHLSRSNLSRGE